MFLHESVSDGENSRVANGHGDIGGEARCSVKRWYGDESSSSYMIGRGRGRRGGGGCGGTFVFL